MKKRPVNLNLFTIHFPIPAWVSLCHRLSGIFIFLFIPGLLWIFNESLASGERFQALGLFFSHPGMRFMLWVLISALLYHLFAGIRHLLMDIHVGESKKAGRFSAFVVIIFSFIAIMVVGVWLW